MTTVHLAYPDRDAAITALATHGLTVKDRDGNDHIPSVTFALGPRIDIVIAGGGTGIETRSTGEMQPGPEGMPPMPVYEALPGFRLMVAGEGLPEFGEAVVTDGEGEILVPPVPEVPDVPASVTNYQGRAVMRQFPNPKDPTVSLFTAVDTDLRAAVEATRGLGEFDEARVEADLAWQAWEQANFYDRRGRITGLLQARYGVSDPQADALFRQADRVTA